MVSRSRGVLLQAGSLASVLVLVGLPVTALVVEALRDGPRALVAALARVEAREALGLTLATSAAAAAVSALTGTLTAWVLVRCPFPGRTVLDLLVDVPFALPTLVTGVMLVELLGPRTLVGRAVAPLGLHLTYSRPAVLIALLFVCLPFVVRSVQPVLLELNPAEEEAAITLGASPWQTFRMVTLPGLAPAILSGTLLAFARGLGEFGSVVLVSGNLPGRTLTAPVYVYAQIEGGRVASAAAVSTVLLLLSAGLLYLTERISRRHQGGAVS